MVSDEWSPSNSPVLVLSCVPDSSSTRLSCINVVRNLELKQLSRPWQVCVNVVCVKLIEWNVSGRVNHTDLSHDDANDSPTKI